MHIDYTTVARLGSVNCYERYLPYKYVIRTQIGSYVLLTPYIPMNYCWINKNTYPNFSITIGSTGEIID